MNAENRKAFTEGKQVGEAEAAGSRFYLCAPGKD
jgi:hypothetical protein